MMAEDLGGRIDTRIPANSMWVLNTFTNEACTSFDLAALSACGELNLRQISIALWQHASPFSSLKLPGVAPIQKSCAIIHDHYNS